MLTLVLGGAASGKSEYAESLVLKTALPRYYLATMQVWDAECAARVAKHRKMRARKQFTTVECPLHLEQVQLPARGTALLEDLGNLTANELYSPGGAGKHAARAVLDGVEGGLRHPGLLQRRDPGMIVLQTMAVAFAMFSALPVPQFTWNSKNMRYALCAFPLIGGVIGALWSLCGALPLPDMIRAGGFCLIPVLVTGGIHLDGYADTSDALSSYGDREKKLEILKDPHCGAFAVIRLCTYFLAYFCVAFCIRFSPRVGLCWTLALVLERGLSGLAVAAFPMAKNTGLAHTFATAADRESVQKILIVLSVLLAAALIALGGGALVAAALLVLWRYHHVAVKEFGGITGDLAGWFLQKAEFWMLAALSASQWGGIL